jgi:uncharacterized membrane protein YccC
MSAGAYSLRKSMLSTLFQASRPEVPVRVALRNTLAVVLPLAFGFASGQAAIGIGVAAGALNVMFYDQPGPYLQRLRQIGLSAVAAALSGLVGFLIGAHSVPLVLAVALGGFAGGMLVVFGPNSARVGMTSMILLVITAATPLPWHQALPAALLILSGGLLQALFSVAAWPLLRYGPERAALATVYRGLAELARGQSHDTDAPPVTEAMTALQQTLLGRDHARGRAMEAFRVLLELAERIRLELLALAGSGGNAGDARQAMFHGDAARVLAGIADALDAAEPPQRAAHALKTLQATQAAFPANTGGALALHTQALGGQLAAAVRNANWAGSRGELRASTAETTLPKVLRSGAALATLRANLTPSSVAFRHAVRYAICLALAVAVSRQAGLAHGYWLPMTAAIVLRADFGATFKFGLLRVVGTVLGLVLTTLLLRLTPDAIWPHLILMTLLCFAFRYLASAHYGIAVAALTGTVVILLAFEGVDSGGAVVDRVVNTALGSGMALLAYVLWPTWERGRARAALADMLSAYAGYLGTLAAPAPPAARREARTAARTARSNAQASLDRLRSEPATAPELVDLAVALFANGNRVARTAMALEAVLGDDDRFRFPCADAVADYVDTAERALQVLATALRDATEPPPLPDLRGLQRALATQLGDAPERHAAETLVAVSDRLTDNIDTLAHVLSHRRTVHADASGT